MCDPATELAATGGSLPCLPQNATRVSSITLRTPLRHNAELYRTTLGDIPEVRVVEGPRLDGFVCDAVIAPTNSYGYLDSGLDGIFARRFGTRLQRMLQERISHECDHELPIGEALIVPTGDFALPFLVASPATRLPGSISVEPYLFSSIHAALRATDRWNDLGEGPMIESVALPDIARYLPEWQPERLIMQLRQAIVEWVAQTPRGLERARAA